VIMLGHRRSRRPPYASSDPRIRYVQGNIENLSALEAAFKGADCIFHIGTPAPVTKSYTRRENRPARYPALSNVRHLCSAALVGPFYKKEMYWRVNLNGTKNVIAACKSQNVRKVVCAGTPSTRMDGRDIDGKTEDELPMPKRFTAHYAETKALAELALREAAEEGHLLTVTVCPHQVALLAPRHKSTPCINAAGTAPTPPCFLDLCYRQRAISTCGTCNQVYGPRDALFFPNILKVAKSKRSRPSLRRAASVGSGTRSPSLTRTCEHCGTGCACLARVKTASPCATSTTTATG
jgi:hypothetical protein